MKKNIFIIVLIQIVTICIPSFTQDSIITKPLTEGLVTANKNLLYNLVTVVSVDGDVSRGFLVGTKADTLILFKDEQNAEFPVRKLLTVTINTQGNNLRGLLIGGILGMYLGNLAFFQVENQPTAYWRGESEGWKAIASILMAFVGGGVGYLIDISTQNDTEEFTFSGDKKDQIKELDRLRAFLKGEQLIESKVHLGIQMSQVNTRYSEFRADENDPYYYGYDEVTSFNLLRKIQLTYQIQEDLEIGGAISWFGEPSIFWYSNFGGGTNVMVTQTYDGVGYYAVAVYHPFASIFSELISWSIGAGIGMGNIDYHFEQMRTVGSYPEITEEETTKRIDKTVFSALLNTQFDLYLIKELSIGLMADYVFVPGEMPAIPNTDIRERSPGNFSFGFALGFHF
jgi:hypothetical protein